MANLSYDITNYSDTFSNVIIIDDLTPDIVKRKYKWIFNARIKDAILGEDDYGLIWYTGEWFYGEWIDGTWNSGIWHDGEWRDGKWYSRRYDVRNLRLHRKRIIEEDNPHNSIFKTGVWRNGTFFNGIFGPSETKSWASYALVNVLDNEPRWEDGIFQNGVFRNSSWVDGGFENGLMYNSQWVGGTFLNGTFQGHTWWNGRFSGGDFISGNWLDGIFSRASKTLKSRFGSNEFYNKEQCKWYGGDFIGGEFHSPLTLLSGVTVTSKNHNNTHWYGGNFNNGTWFGGTFHAGEHNNGYWYDGVFSGATSESSIWNNGYWLNGLWINGTFNQGYFGNGIWKDGIFNKGRVGRDVNKLDEDLSVTKRPYTYENFLGISYSGDTAELEDIGGSGGGEGKPIYWGINYRGFITYTDSIQTNEQIFASMSEMQRYESLSEIDGLSTQSGEQGSPKPGYFYVFYPDSFGSADEWLLVARQDPKVLHLIEYDPPIYLRMDAKLEFLDGGTSPNFAKAVSYDKIILMIDGSPEMYRMYKTNDQYGWVFKMNIFKS